MNIQSFLAREQELYAQLEDIPRGCYSPLPFSEPAGDAPVIVLFSAHPDDEVLSFAPLALRFRAQGWRVINVAMTMGEDEKERKRREEELRGACDFLRFELRVHSANNLTSPRKHSRNKDRMMWVRVVEKFLREARPRAVITHHLHDGHPTHEGVSLVVGDAIRRAEWGGMFFESEFWHEMKSPNLMVEVSVSTIANMMKALSFHEGEVKRNPRFLQIPAYLRGKTYLWEKVSGFGTKVKSGQGQVEYAALFRMTRYNRGALLKDGSREPQLFRSIDCVENLLSH